MSNINFTNIRKRFQALLTGILALVLIFLSGFEDAVSQNSVDTEDDIMVQLQQDRQRVTENVNLITVQISNLTIAEALEKIAEQIKVGFSYNPDIMPDKTVSLELVHTPAYMVIYKVLEGTNLEPVLPPSKDVIVIREKEQPEEEEIFQDTVRGTVVDAQTGEALPGVNILIEGTATGTTTNINGEFELNVPSLDITLVFSYIGYDRLVVNIEGRSELNIELTSDVQMLEDIVVIGYQTQRLEEVTGSVSRITAEQIVDNPAVDASTLLQGTASGVTVSQNNRPGDGGIVRIRGLGTINNNDPLWVVDGVPGASVIPQDIESITVLKDASAQAIYGARGANGVIVVTTKSGARNQSPQVSVSVRSGINQNVNSFDLLNTREWGEWYWLHAKNSGIENINHPQYGSGPEPDIPEYIIPARGTNVNHDLYDNLLPHQNGTDTFLITKANQEGTDWMDAVTRNAMFQQYSIGLSGGSESTRYAVTLNHRDEDGILQYTGFSRQSIRVNISSNITDWLEIGERLNVTYETFQGNRGNHSNFSPISLTYRMQPIIPVFDIAGNHAGTQAAGTDNAPSAAFALWSARDNYTKRLSGIGNAYANLSITEGLELRGVFGFDLRQGNSRNINYNEVAQDERGLYDGVNESNNVRIQQNWTATLRYFETFQSHQVEVLLGAEQIMTENRFVSASRNDFFFSNPNYIQLSVGERDVSNNSGMSEWALNSQFTRLNYNYDNRYLLETTVRRDGSSRFSRDNRYGIFPAVSLGWRLSSESFMSSFTDTWLEDLKIRASWGRSGNDQVGNYNSFTTFRSSPNNSYYPITGSSTSATSGFIASTIGNPATSWEETTTINLGVDIDFGNLSFTLDLWERETNDMLYQQGIPNIFGQAAAPSINVGNMLNRGIDFNVDFFGQAFNQSLQYDISLNISRYTNEILKLSEAAGEFITGPAGARTEVGRSFPEFYGYVVEGIFQSQEEADAHPPAFGSTGTYNEPGHFKFRDVNGDGVINANDRTYIGSPHPDFTSGLNINLRYKNFRTSTNIFMSYGNDMINWTRNHIDFNTWYGNRSKRALYESWGSPYLDNNEDAKMPKVRVNDGGHREMSSYFVEDASYLRMQNLLIGYNLGNLFPNLNFRNLEIYAQVTNLFTITNYSGLDPELGRGGMGMGVDDGAWPTPRQYLFGISLEL